MSDLVRRPQPENGLVRACANLAPVPDPVVVIDVPCTDKERRMHEELDRIAIRYNRGVRRIRSRVPRLRSGLPYAEMATDRVYLEMAGRLDSNAPPFRQEAWLFYEQPVELPRPRLSLGYLKQTLLSRQRSPKQLTE